MDSDISTWLESESRWPKFYYADVDAQKWYAGVGAKSSVKVDKNCSIAEVEKKLREFTKNHDFVFSGICFDGQFDQSSEWQDFGIAQFICPEDLRSGNDFHASVSTNSDAGQIPPISDDWRTLFNHSSNAFSTNDLEKVVLAYRSNIKRKDNIWDRMMRAPSSFRFAFSPIPGHVFYGASPELLFRKVGREIQSDALAGTRIRNDREETDLLENTKDRVEHQLVVDFLVNKLTNFCSQVRTGETTIKQLQHLVHLHTLVSGTIASENLVFSQLHPTPALSGTPQIAALDFLREYEGFDRGWYGGTIGVIDDEFESFAVAIRSVLQTPSDAFVYFGAGVVPDSDCKAEWNEIHSKRSAILANLGEAL